MNPVFPVVAEFGQALFRGAAFNRQQAQVVGLALLVIKQLGGAHGGAPGLGGELPLAEIGKEQGVDELGLATGVFANKGNGQVVVPQQDQAAVEVALQVLGVELAGFQPLAVALNFPDQVVLP